MEDSVMNTKEIERMTVLQLDRHLRETQGKGIGEMSRVEFAKYLQNRLKKAYVEGQLQVIDEAISTLQS
jgi:hypothetical protein